MESFVNEVAGAVATATGADAAEVANLIQTPKDASRGDLAIACFKLAASLGRPGKDGAQVLDVFTFFSKRAGSRSLQLEDQPRDEERRVYEASWRQRRRRRG